MDAIRYLPDMLQEITDLMTEKELRLRTPLEELDLLLGSSKATAAAIESTTTETAADTL